MLISPGSFRNPTCIPLYVIKCIILYNYGFICLQHPLYQLYNGYTEFTTSILFTEPAAFEMILHIYIVLVIPEGQFTVSWNL